MTSPAPAPQPRGANLFEFTTHSGATKIAYYPFAPGPIIQGRTPGPSFQYDGPEGSLSFRNGEITQENTPLGQLVSVVLKPLADSGSLTFSLFLPPVAMGSDNSQSFTTYGVKTRHAGLAEKPGPQLSYETERLNSVAKTVEVAL